MSQQENCSSIIQPISPRKFNANAFKSPVFKVILADVDNAEYYIHKELLTSFSLEMKNHVENTMREGIEGQMVLHQVEEETMHGVLEWAYEKEYTILSDPHDTKGAMIEHMKLYIFADRFNINPLRDLCLSNLAHTLSKYGPTTESFSINCMTTMKTVLQVIDYGMENLPSHKDKAIMVLLNYLSDSIPYMDELSDLVEFLEQQPEIEEALLTRLYRSEKEQYPTSMMRTQSRALAECSSCNKVSLVYWFECKATIGSYVCGYAMKASNDGWFDTDWEDLKCPRCRGPPSGKCRVCCDPSRKRLSSMCRKQDTWSLG